MTATLWLLTLIGGFLVLALVAHGRARRKRAAQRDFIRRYAFPEALKTKLHSRHPQLSSSALDEVIAALREWFLLLQQHPREKFGMPSRVVDDAWHEFILMTRQYKSFCEKGFGNYVHHEPNQADAEQNSAALGRTLERTGGRRALGALGAASGVAVAGVALFAIDEKLGVADGFSYTPDALESIERDYRTSVASSGGGGGCSGYSSGDSSDGGGGDGGGGGGCGGGGCGS